MKKKGLKMVRKIVSILIVCLITSICFAASPSNSTDNQEQNQSQDQSQNQNQEQTQGQVQGQNQILIDNSRHTSTSNADSKSTSNSDSKASALGIGLVDTSVSTNINNPVQPIQPVLPSFGSTPQEIITGWNTELKINNLTAKTEYTRKEAKKIFNYCNLDFGWIGALRNFKYDVVCWEKHKTTNSIQVIESASNLNIEGNQIATINLTAKDAEKFLLIFGDDTISCSTTRVKWAVAVLAMNIGGNTVVYKVTETPVVRGRSEGLGSIGALGGNQGSLSLNAGGVVGSSEKEIRPGITAVVLR